MTLAELGSILQNKREEMGLSIDDISERIKVSVRIIRLIEEGNTFGLPHSVYTRGFIISYAEVLQMDKEELMQALDEIFPSEDIEEVQTMSQPLAPTRVNRSVRMKQLLISVIFLLIVCSVIAGGWFVFDRFGKDVIEFVKQPFSATVDEPQQTQPQTVETTSYPPSQPVASPALPDNPLTPPQAGEVQPAPVAPVTLPQSSAPGTPEPVRQADGLVTSSGETATESRTDNVAVISARAPCWTRVTADGKQLPDLTIIPGRDFTFQYSNNATITLGNPSAVLLTVNGEPYAGNLKSSQSLTITLP